MTPCIICAKVDPEDGWTVCRGCLDHIDDDLRRIVELTRYAGERLIPETRPRPGHSGASDNVTMPVSVTALDDALGADTLPVLESWIRLIREEAGLSPYGVATEGQAVTVASSVAWLRSWLLWAAERVDFPIEDLALEMRSIVRALTHYDPTYVPANSTGTRLLCPAEDPEGDGTKCHGRVTYDRDRPRDDITCRRCGTVWTGPRLLLLALGDETQVIWAYPADILAIVDIPPATLRKWVQRGQLTRDGGRYDIGQAWRWRMRVGA